MTVERSAGGGSLIDVLDRVLEGGIVVDERTRATLPALDLACAEACVVVAGVETRLAHGEPPALRGAPVVGTRTRADDDDERAHRDHVTLKRQLARLRR